MRYADLILKSVLREDFSTRGYYAGEPIVRSEKIDTILHQLAELPYADRIIIFGSVARGDTNRWSDVDLWIDWGSDKAPPGLINITKTHYGSIDSFFTGAPGSTIDGKMERPALFVRNDHATGWQQALNRRSIEKAIKTEGVPLREILARESPPRPSAD